MKSKSIINLSEVNKIVGSGENKKIILRDINLTIQSGEFVTIVGKSGSGKSSLLNIIGLLDSPSSGEYSFNGMSIIDFSEDRLAEIRNKIFGFIFQRYYLLNNLTAIENVELPAIYLGLPAELRRKRAMVLLSSLGLRDKCYNLPTELSGGQQQRISIARALINGANIILADEPTGALDIKNGQSVIDILRKLNADGHTVVIVTHNSDIAKNSDRVIELQDGEIISDVCNKINNRNEENLFLQPNDQTSCNNQFILFYECIKMAIYSLKYHKIRSFLTMLGIIIGITSVVLVLALGRSAKKQILDDIQQLGPNTLEIFPGKNFGDLDAWKIDTLKIEDARSLGQFNFVEHVSVKITYPSTLSYKNISINCLVNGVDSAYSSIRNQKIIVGNFFFEKNVKNIDSNIVIDTNLYKVLFAATENAIGKIVFLNGHPFRVDGVVKDNTLDTSSGIANVYIPYTAMSFKVLGKQRIDSILVKVPNSIEPQFVENAIFNILKLRHSAVDFFIYNSDSIRKAAQKTSSTMTILIFVIAVIALLVGGLGVMNIMLVSVSERTSEIGLRMAIGSRKRDILIQFLCEAIVICLCGGILGIILSTSLIPVSNMFIDNFVVDYSFDSVFIGLIFSLFIGLTFGYLPARKGASLTPKEALQRE